MRHLREIIAANRAAEQQGVADGAPIGTDAYYQRRAEEAAQAAKDALGAIVSRVEGRCPEGGSQPHQGVEGSGLRSHSVGEDYPFSVAGGFQPVPGSGTDIQTVWTVVHQLTGQWYGTFFGEGACERAHAEAHKLAVAWKEGQDGPKRG